MGRLTDRHAEGFHRGDGAGPFAINDASEMLAQDPSWSATLALMRADVRAIRDDLGESVLRRAYPGVFVTWCHRVAHTLHVRRRRIAALAVSWWCHALTGAEIKPGAVLGPGLLVVHPTGVVVNGGVVAGARLRLYGTNTLGANFRDGIHGSPQLGDDVVLGAHAMVLGPCLVGDGVTVGAASVLFSDAAPGTSVKGVPAR